MRPKKNKINTYVADIESNEPPIIDGGSLSNGRRYRVKRQLIKYECGEFNTYSQIKVIFSTSKFEVYTYLAKQDNNVYQGVPQMISRCVKMLEKMHDDDRAAEVRG